MILITTKKRWLIFLFLLQFQFSFSQKHTLYGSIKDSTSFEYLQGVNVSVKDKNIIASSNRYGFYSISLPSGDYTIQFSYVGYKTVEKKISLTKNINIDISLPVESVHLDEFVVTSDKNNRVLNSKSGYNSLSIKKIKSIPSIAGESDLMKSIQLLPGIQVANEGTSNFNVRGGSYDQNLILLDEAPVYNPSHALGFISTFNSDAIKNVEIYKGVFPAQYGGRLSSVVDISMNEGNKQKLTSTGSVGAIASRFTIEGPVFNEKSSFLISGRYSYAGKVLNTLIKLNPRFLKLDERLNSNNDINFYDFNLKYNIEINPKNRLYFSTYKGHDDFYASNIDNAASLDWGNTTATLRWNHIYSPKLFSNIMLIYSNYNYSYILKDDSRHFRWYSDMSEYDLKADYDYFISSSIKIKTGFAVNNHSFSPGGIEPRDSASITKGFKLDGKKTLDAAVYMAINQTVTDRISVDYGLRFNNMLNIGPGKVYAYNEDMSVVTDSTVYGRNKAIKYYQGLDPRVSVRYLLNQKSSVKLAYGHTTQFLHLLSNSSVGLPTDVWIPPDKYIKPQSADQYSVSYFMNFPKRKLELSVETYYKAMNNVIDYFDNADLFLNSHIETQIKTGKGTSYGLELMVEKVSGHFTGWISYTLAKTTLQIDGVNKNNPYPARYDIRHNLSITGSYQIGQTLSVSSTFRITSGGFITIPKGTFYYGGGSFNYYTDRNGYNLPVYNRLDLALTYKSRRSMTRKWKSEWSFSIYNVYGRKNLFSLFIMPDDIYLSNSKAYKMYLFNTVPSVSYNFKF